MWPLLYGNGRSVKMRKCRCDRGAIEDGLEHGGAHRNQETQDMCGGGLLRDFAEERLVFDLAFGRTARYAGTGGNANRMSARKNMHLPPPPPSL